MKHTSQPDPGQIYSEAQGSMGWACTRSQPAFSPSLVLEAGTDTHEAILTSAPRCGSGKRGGEKTRGRSDPPASPSRRPPKHTGLLPSRTGAPPLLPPPRPRGGGAGWAASPPSHRSFSWSSVPGSGCTTKWIDVMFHSPSLRGGGRGPGAQGGGSGRGEEEGQPRGDLVAPSGCRCVSRSHSGAFAPREGRGKAGQRGAREARGDGGKGFGQHPTLTRAAILTSSGPTLPSLLVPRRGEGGAGRLQPKGEW